MYVSSCNVAADIASGFLQACSFAVTLRHVNLRGLAVLPDSIFGTATLLVSDHAQEIPNNADHNEHEDGHGEH